LVIHYCLEVSVDL
jgi:hypothetical protein